MSQRYDAQIQLVVKEKGKYVKLDTWQLLQPYYYFDEARFIAEGSKEEYRWMYSGFRFAPLFTEAEKKYTKCLYWTCKQGEAITGTYSWQFPLEALMRALTAAGHANVTSKNVRSSTFAGGCA